MNMKALLLGGVFAFLSGAAFAEDPVHMVAIMAFSCPSSEEVERYLPVLERSLKSQFRFGPVRATPDDRMARLWYGIRGRDDAYKGRRAMYDMLHKMRMLKYSDVDLAEWVALQGVAMTSDEVIAAMKDDKTFQAVERAGRLAQMADVVRVPTFVYVQGTQILGSLTRSSEEPAEFVQKGLRLYRQFAGEMR